MRSLATKQPINDVVKQKNGERGPSRHISPLSTGMLLQRQCACGGGCPRCQEKLGIQTKLKISEPGDKYEQEADRVADEVMRMPVPSVQRLVEPEEEEDMVQRKAIANQVAPLEQQQESSKVPPTVHEVLRSPGQALDPATRAFMEPRFGHDFSGVRVHSGGAAEQSAQDVSAHAYKVEHDMVFGAVGFAPGTHERRPLIAHELTYVVQQAGADGMTNSNWQIPMLPFQISMNDSDGKTILRKKDKDAAKGGGATGQAQGNCETGHALLWGCDTTCLKYGFTDNLTGFLDERNEEEEFDCCNKWPPLVEMDARDRYGVSGIASCRPGKDKRIATIKYKGTKIKVACMDAIPADKPQLIELSPMAAIDLFGKYIDANVRVCYENKLADKGICNKEMPLPKYPKLSQCVEKRCSPENPFLECKKFWSI